jgi:arabinose-5-phosphate isomerase
MTITFKSIESNALAIDAAEMMEKNKIFSLVVNSSKHKEDTIGIITMHQLLESGII